LVRCSDDAGTSNRRRSRPNPADPGCDEPGVMTMKTLRSFVVLAIAAVLAAVLSAPSFAQVKDYRQLKFPELHPFRIPQPERTVLDNGMVVMLLEHHELPLIEVMARVRTGSRLEPADKAGLAGMFGHVLRAGGTKSMTGDQIDDLLEARAAM